MPTRLTIRIRPMERSDLRKMLDIFSDAIPHSQLSRSIYLASGVEVFLARLLEHTALHSNEQLWGVEVEGSGLVGAAHTRLIGEQHHLNNYAVLPSFQGHGLGGRMMEHWQSLARALRARRLSLDVALENEKARRHYSSFGFNDESQSHEYRLEQPANLADSGGIQLQDWPSAQASFQAYGFGRFTLALGAKKWQVDLRDGTFRLGSGDARVLAALRIMDPARIILVRSSEVLEGPQWAYTGTIVRMSRDL